MKINAVTSYSVNNLKSTGVIKMHQDEPYQAFSTDLMNSLDSIAKLNYISFKASQKPSYQINLSSEELVKRTKRENFSDYKMLDVDSPQYKSLSKADQETLKHLVKAARILNNVYLRQDSIHNLPFRNNLIQEAKKGNKDAKMTLELFNAQKSINAKDVNGDEVNLAKNHSELPGKGFYPEDLSKEEFHQILIKMLENGEKDAVKEILNQRTMVIRDGDKLKAIDYTKFFADEFEAAANELELASYTSTNQDFTSYLIYQVDALLQNNPYIDSMADQQWATMQETPLEFTIARESYDDKMTPSVSENPKLMTMLEQEGIVPYPKDNLGVRVGIVNKEGTDYILKIKDYMPMLAAYMPFKEEYTQTISTNSNNQTMVDVDIVDMQGRMGAYQGAISLASNLPNNDKLAIKQGGGKRNVYHVQMRNSKYAENIQAKLDAILEPSLHKYFDTQALHDFTILHENLHSLGPKTGLEKLGVYKNTIEENKADMGALVMLDVLTKKGFYTPTQQKKVITSYLMAYVLKGPNFENAHKKRNILQHNYFIQNGAVKVSDGGKMSIDFEKVTELSKKMLEQVIRIQIDGNPEKAKEYIEKNMVWSQELDRLAKNLRKADTTLNSKVVTPLGDMLARQF